MPLRALTAVLAFFILIGTGLSSALPTGAWYCEGKQCGISLWGCCCDEHYPPQHEKCRFVSVGSVTHKHSAACKAKCGCAMIISSNTESSRSLPPLVSAVSSLIAVAIVPAPVAAYVPPALTDISLLRFDTRGPPFQSIARSSLSLRAPPAA